MALFRCEGTPPMESSGYGNKVIYLGSGISFDVKALVPDIDYSKLTNDNFIVEVLGWSAATKQTSNGEISSYVTAKVTANTIGKNYNNSSGVLVINNAKVTAGASSRGASTSVTSELNINVYLVSGNIENNKGR